MYLEISNVAAALGKNPYESCNKMLLTSWARHCPKKVLNYLIQTNCILPLSEDEETFSQLQGETYKEMVPDNYDVKDFSKIEQNVVQEYKRKRNNEQTEDEVKQLKEFTKDLLKKNNGNIQENAVIKKENYTKGNDKMYYFEIMENACIGGKNDASVGDILLEIKTRTRKQNVRRNEYDLYQLICYLLATGKKQGKLVQMYNKEKYDSDTPNDNEYGIISLDHEDWRALSNEIIEGLKQYFTKLDTLIKTSNFMYLDSVIPKNIRPISKYIQEEDNMEFCDENIKFKNLLRHLSKC